MEAHSGEDDHDGGQKGRMDSTFIAIKWRLLGRRWSNGTLAIEPPNIGGTKTGSEFPEIDAHYSGSFCSLTPEMSTWTDMESHQ
jgi:hypothetical protein